MPAYRSGVKKKNLTKRQSAFFTFHANANTAIDVIANSPEQGNDTPNAEIHVLGAGDVSVERVDGTTVTIAGVPAGYVLPISVRAIRSTANGTTATNILVLY